MCILELAIYLRKFLPLTVKAVQPLTAVLKLEWPWTKKQDPSTSDEKLTS